MSTDKPIEFKYIEVCDMLSLANEENETLKAKIESLEKENQSLNKTVDHENEEGDSLRKLHELFAEWADKTEVLETRNQELEKALKLISAYDDGTYDGCCPYGCDTPTIALEALKTKDQHEDLGGGSSTKGDQDDKNS